MKKRPAHTRKGPSLKNRAAAALAQLKQHSSQKVRDGMARYDIPSDHALGVPVGAIQKIAKQLGRDHALAEALWDTGGLRSPAARVVCRRPRPRHAGANGPVVPGFRQLGGRRHRVLQAVRPKPARLEKIAPWAKKKDEFQKRAGMVMIACLAAHDKKATDKAFLRILPVIAQAATDERNFVKKGVSWALRMVGRRNAVFKAASVTLARELTESASPAAQWIGKDALKQSGKG